MQSSFRIRQIFQKPRGGFLGFSTALLFLCFPALLSSLTAEELSAKEILHAARINQISQDVRLNARLRTDADTTPFQIALEGGEIRYEFSDPEEAVILRLGEDESELLLRRGGKQGPVRPTEAGERLRQSSLTYEDLALRFLYWPGAKYLGSDVIRTRSAHRLELHPHDRRSLYGAARVWIDKASGALLRVEGYDWEGKLIKRFEVVSAQRIDGQWFLKSMRVETFDPETRKVSDRTYLDVLGLTEENSP